MGFSKIDSFLYKRTLEDYVSFYHLLPKVNELNGNSPLLSKNKDYHNFLLVTGKHCPALCHVGKYVDKIPIDRKYSSFYFNNPMFWVIPIETASNRIVGFILKSFDKRGYNVIHYSKISLLFGLYDFNDYTKNQPIILTEGWRDCIYVKKFYKYVLSLNTSSLNKGTLELLSHMTNKLIFVYDNDQTGNKMSESNALLCRNKNIATFSIKPMLKDMGEYFTNPVYEDKFVMDLNFALKSFS